MKEVFPILGIYLLCASFVSFVMMGIDKGLAKKGLRRIRERTLFLAVLLGGGIGGMLGMNVFRHKTLHWQFRIGFPAITLLEYAGIAWLLFRFF